MNKKFLKALALVGCALLLVTASVVGTYAVLTSTASVTNTFTAGNVKITMDEAKVDVYGKVITGEGAGRVPDGTLNGNSYKLVPKHTYTKDPTIYVDANSELCWLFVKVVNGIADAEIAADDTAAVGETETIAEQMAANGWVSLGVDNVYYHAIANAGATVKVFESFTIKSDANVETFEGATITVTAYAVQADGFAVGTGTGEYADAGLAAKAAWTAASFS